MKVRITVLTENDKPLPPVEERPTEEQIMRAWQIAFDMMTLMGKSKERNVFGLIRKKGEDKMGDFNLCPKCGGVPTYKLVGDNRTLIVAICSECGYCPAKSGDARYTEKEALKIWNKRTSEISYKLWKLKHRWIVKGDLLVCPQCNVAQKKPKETEPTPFCPICGAWLTDETTQEWILKNTVSSKVDTEEKIET